jgi:Ca2+-binding EF-hand superfamily protein
MSMEEENSQAVVDLKVTVGRSKDATNVIWASPGVGWIRVDGNFNRGYGGHDAFLWMRPVKVRLDASKLVSPHRSGLAVSEDSKVSSLVEAVRAAIRSFVPVNIVQLIGVEGQAPAVPLSAEVLAAQAFDFSSLFSQFDKHAIGEISYGQLHQMLLSAGVNIDKRDMRIIAHRFDVFQRGTIKRTDFCDIMSLTQYEVDCVIRSVRHALRGKDVHAGVLAAEGSRSETSLPTSLIRNKILIDTFRAVDLDSDGRLSMDEVKYMLACLDIFLTQSELISLKGEIDKNVDNLLEQDEFLRFMSAVDETVYRSAARVRDAAVSFGTWATQARSNQTPADGIDSYTPWLEMKRMHISKGSSKFPGYLSCNDFMICLNRIGVRLHAVEARALTFIVAPTQSGHIHQKDIHEFMRAPLRTFAELYALLERSLLRDLFNLYRAYRESALKHFQETGFQALYDTDTIGDEALRDAYEDALDSCTSCIVHAAALEASHANTETPGVKEQAVVGQLITGVAEFGKYEARVGPSAHEWASLALHTDSVSFADEQYGVNITKLLEGLLWAVVGPLLRPHQDRHPNIESVATELRVMIQEEAKAGKRRSDSKLDYTIPFALFDEDGNGFIPLQEFESSLHKLHLNSVGFLGKEDVSKLMSRFDRSSRGCITLDDFIAFAEGTISGAPAPSAQRENKRRLIDVDDTDEEEQRSLALPPLHLAKDEECNGLMWMLWGSCKSSNPSDPEVRSRRARRPR